MIDSAAAMIVIARALVVLVLGCSSRGEDLRRPNVLFILADDLGFGDLGAYVAAHGTYKSYVPDTPRLDALAASGRRFDNFRVMSPVCSPSRVAFMTGSPPTRVGYVQHAACHASYDAAEWYVDSAGVERSASTARGPGAQKGDSIVLQLSSV